MSDDCWAATRMEAALAARKAKGTIRKLQYSSSGEASSLQIDFSSNDYLGLANDQGQHELVEREFEKFRRKSSNAVLGATGSRLLSGDCAIFHQVEDYLRKLHNRSAALIFNSGYDANLAVVSCLPCDVLVFDEYAHNSLHMGMRLWQTEGTSKHPDNSSMQKRAMSFRHNDAKDLQRTLQGILRDQPAAKVVVLVESVYSMDGDVAPLEAMLPIAHSLGAQMIVDEAHGLGVYGRSERESETTGLPPGTGVLAAKGLERHPALLCSIHTFGKAAGCHGAVTCFATQTHKLFLTNYGYPFIYSTALPLHSVITIQCSYQTMTGAKGISLRSHLNKLIALFHEHLGPILLGNRHVFLIPSTSPIQALVVRGNSECSRFCDILFELSGEIIRLFPIKSPTVPAGQERVRIIIHASNTEHQVKLLVSLIVQTLQDMKLFEPLMSRI